VDTALQMLKWLLKTSESVMIKAISRYKIFSISLTAFVLFTTSTLMAKEITDIGIGLQNFSYAEYDGDQLFLDGETKYLMLN